MGPMDGGGGPQQLLSQGVGGAGMGAIGPTMPQGMMPPGGMPGLGSTGLDPHKIMAYIQALKGNVSGGMPAGQGSPGGGGGVDLLKWPGGPDYTGPGSSNPMFFPTGF